MYKRNYPQEWTIEFIEDNKEVLFPSNYLFGMQSEQLISIFHLKYYKRRINMSNTDIWLDTFATLFKQIAYRYAMLLVDSLEYLSTYYNYTGDTFKKIRDTESLDTMTGSEGETDQKTDNMPDIPGNPSLNYNSVTSNGTSNIETIGTSAKDRAVEDEGNYARLDNMLRSDVMEKELDNIRVVLNLFADQFDILFMGYIPMDDI